MKTIQEATVRDYKMLSQTREEAKKEAMQLMLAGDLKGYFKKLLLISEMDNYVHQMAA